MKLDRAIVFITGANRGIGRALAEAARDGGSPRIYAAARKVETLEELVATAPERIVPIRLDVTSDEQAREAAEKAPDANVLINNAGILTGATFLDAPDLDDARQEMEVNYFGSIRMARTFAPILAKTEGAAVVQIASVAGLASFPLAPTYSATKAAAHSLAQGLRHELAGQKTSVLGVYPGPIETDMTDRFELETTPPSEVARAIFEALERGDEEVFPDPMAEETARAYREDPKAVEKRFASMARA